MTAEELYNKLQNVQPGSVLCHYSMKTCEDFAKKINRINQLKKEQNTVILAHYYLSPEILMGVADYSGDSYKLSKDALETDANTIIFAAVRFMGETAKILNPDKTILIPGSSTGCSLADSITAQDVIDLKAKFPEHTFMCYINTTADVKAECDVCVTSSNVYNIIEKHPSDKIFFVPDFLMGQNVITEMKKRGVKKDIQLFDGHCYVHKQYDAEIVDFFKKSNDNLAVVCHPECTPEVVKQADFVGSTGQMAEYIKNSNAESILLLTECGLNASLQAQFPEKNFIGSCSMCLHMKSNNLDNILEALENPKESMVVKLDENVRIKAKKCIDAMFKYAN